MAMAGHDITAFVLAGGGSLGAVQVGMLHALLEHGVHADFVVGSSVGAINAANFAGNPTIEGILQLEELWARIRRADIFPLSWSSLRALLKRSDSLVDPGNLGRLLADNLPYKDIADARLPLHVMATDQQGMGVRISQGNVVQAVLASAAVPGIFPPVVISGRPLMDGAIAANTPLCMAADLGATRIIVLPTGYACALGTAPKGVIGRILHAITLLVAWQLMHEIAAMADRAVVHVAPALCPLAISPYDFSASRQLIARSRRSTHRWISEGGLSRPASPSELKAHHH